MRLSDVLLVVVAALVLAGIFTSNCSQKTCDLRVVGVDARLGDVAKCSQGLVALLALDTLFLTTTVALVVALDNRVELAVTDWVTVLVEFSAELLTSRVGALTKRSPVAGLRKEVASRS